MSSFVSAVVVPLLGGPALARCIEQVTALRLRCIVVAPSAMRPSVADARGSEFLPCDGPIPQRRAVGVRATSSEWVAIIEDTCRLQDSWASGLRNLEQLAAADAVCGPVVLSTTLAPRFMALGCVEYGEFPPSSAGPAAYSAAIPAGRLPGLCILYRRRVMLELEGGEDLIETVIQQRIVERGGQLVLDPDLAVTYDASDRRAASCAARFAHGRIFGGLLRRNATLGRRTLSVMGAPLLPLVLLRRAWRGLPRGYRARLQVGVGILAFTMAWSLGELTGVIGGRAEDVRSWR